ncbi:hypothetical protein [Bifidobacterium tissieri]|uniref:hypothetical protein n=1 Tax=Bifidobacterium tissieri TaxID=1630162 RepID=UPI00130318CE|nr:hypothetical protein [Bifidobacterium tissieri]
MWLQVGLADVVDEPLNVTAFFANKDVGGSVEEIKVKQGHACGVEQRLAFDERSSAALRTGDRMAVGFVWMGDIVLWRSQKI